MFVVEICAENIEKVPVFSAPPAHPGGNERELNKYLYTPVTTKYSCLLIQVNTTRQSAARNTSELTSNQHETKQFI